MYIAPQTAEQIGKAGDVAQRVAPFKDGPPSMPGLDDFGGHLIKGGLPLLLSKLGLGAANPYLALAQIGLPLLGHVWDQFTESPREKLEKEILQARRERLGDLRRQAKGQFTASQREGILRANAPVMERVATNLAMRGIEGSGAAGQLLTEAEQAPFFQAQQQAQLQLDDYELKTFGLAQQLVEGDESVGQALGEIVGYFEDPNEPQDMELEGLNSMMTEFQEWFANFKEEFGDFATELEN